MQGEPVIWTCTRCGQINTTLRTSAQRYACEGCRSVFNDIEEM